MSKKRSWPRKQVNEVRLAFVMFIINISFHHLVRLKNHVLLNPIRFLFSEFDKYDSDKIATFLLSRRIHFKNLDYSASSSSFLSSLTLSD